MLPLVFGKQIRKQPVLVRYCRSFVFAMKLALVEVKLTVGKVLFCEEL